MQCDQVVRRRWVGVIGGGVGMAVALLAAAGLSALHGQSPAFPARLVASLVLGQAALTSEDGATVVVGLFILAVLGALAGIWFAFMCDWFPGLAQTPGTLVLSGGIYAIFLWLIGFYLFGLLIWPWLTQTDPVVYVLAALLGGASLGAVFVLNGVHRIAQLD